MELAKIQQELRTRGWMAGCFSIITCVTRWRTACWVSRHRGRRRDAGITWCRRWASRAALSTASSAHDRWRPGEKLLYSGWSEQVDCLRQMTAGLKRVAMQYSRCARFHM